VLTWWLVAAAHEQQNGRDVAHLVPQERAAFDDKRHHAVFAAARAGCAVGRRLKLDSGPTQGSERSCDSRRAADLLENSAFEAVLRLDVHLAQVAEVVLTDQVARGFLRAAARPECARAGAATPGTFMAAMSSPTL
jgi:hypothetical protein